MSSILKALEKVEDAQNERRAGGAAGLPRRRERRPAWLIPAWAVGGAAFASLVTFAVMGGFSKAPVPASGPIAKTAIPAPAPAAVAPLNAVAAPSVTPGASAPAPAAIMAAPVPGAPLSRSVAEPARKSAARMTKSLPVPALPAAKPALARPVPVQVVPALAAPAPAAVPDEIVPDKPRQEIRVTGIAWQGSSESSFAMVNGRAVRHGGTVDGFKVERILEDSVRLSGSSGSITVPLGAGEQ